MGGEVLGGDTTLRNLIYSSYKRMPDTLIACVRASGWNCRPKNFFSRLAMAACSELDVTPMLMKLS